MSLIEENANFLSKLSEDPYSDALMEVIKERKALIENQIYTLAYKIKPEQLYHLEGQLFAIKRILEIPDEAKNILNTLNEEA